MLAGVGGKTVSEAKANMSYREVRNWLYYINEHGSVSPNAQNKHILDQLEFISAKICWAVMRSVGADKVQISDFIPDALKPATKNDSEELAIVDDVFKFLKAVSKVNKK